MKNILLTLNGVWFALLGTAIWLHFEGEWGTVVITAAMALGILWFVHYLTTDSDC